MKIFLKYLLMIIFICGTKTEVGLVEDVDNDIVDPDSDSNHALEYEPEEMRRLDNEDPLPDVEKLIEDAQQVTAEQEKINSQGAKVIENPDQEEPSYHDKVKVDEAWLDQQQKFKQISLDYRKMEQRYKDCINAFDDIDYNQKNVIGCIGINYNKPINETKYEKKKQLGIIEIKIKNLMYQECYIPAADNKVWAIGCDILEKDILDFLWAELNFNDIINFNKDRYLFIKGKIPVENFVRVMKDIDVLYKDIFNIITEIDDHQDLMIINIRTFIDGKTNAMKNKINFAKKNIKPVLKKKKVNITSFLQSKKFIDLAQLPRPLVLDGTTHNVYAKNQRPELEKLVDDKRYDYVHNFNREKLTLDKGPVVSMPEKKSRELISRNLLKRNLRFIRHKV